jgi:L-cysteine desulfidase
MAGKSNKERRLLFMNRHIEKNYIDILKAELVPALGCTEPIAVAYAFAKARELLGTFPEQIELLCSGNIIKNVKGVTVPNSGGLKGLDVASVLGVVGGNPARELEVLEEVTPEHIQETKRLLETDFFTCSLREGVENLYIVAKLRAGNETASVTIVNRHTLITEMEKNGDVVYRLNPTEQEESTPDRSLLNFDDILAFAETVELDKIKPILEQQVKMNSAISKVGLEGGHGARIGRTLLDVYGYSLENRARANAAAGSDARMNGCSMPVVINSGSGNQGMTVSLPVIEYATALGVTKEKMYRALALSNLLSIHQKYYIGSLSAFCGAVTAASASGAAITYLHGGTSEQIANTMINTLANVGGIVCDGAKSSCAAKIASAVDAAILAHHMSMRGYVFQSGEGLVGDTVEETIQSIGYVGRVGMKSTDVEILNVMIGKANVTAE